MHRNQEEVCTPTTICRYTQNHENNTIDVKLRQGVSMFVRDEGVKGYNGFCVLMKFQVNEHSFWLLNTLLTRNFEIHTENTSSHRITHVTRTSVLNLRIHRDYLRVVNESDWGRISSSFKHMGIKAYVTAEYTYCLWTSMSFHYPLIALLSVWA